MYQGRSGDGIVLNKLETLAQGLPEFVNVQDRNGSHRELEHTAVKPSWMRATLRRHRLKRARSLFGFRKEKSGNDDSARSSRTTLRASTLRGKTAYGYDGASKSEGSPTFTGSPLTSPSSPQRLPDTRNDACQSQRLSDTQRQSTWSSLKGRVSRKHLRQQNLNGKTPEDEWTVQGRDGSYSSLRTGLRSWKSTLFSDQDLKYERQIPMAPPRETQADMRGSPSYSDDPEPTNDRISPRTTMEKPRPWAPPLDHPHIKWRLGFDGTVDSQTRPVNSPPAYKSLSVTRRHFTDRSSTSGQGSGDSHDHVQPETIGSDDATIILKEPISKPVAIDDKVSHCEGQQRRASAPLTPSKKLYNGTVSIVTNLDVGRIHSGNIPYDATEDPLVPRQPASKIPEEDRRGRSPTPRPHVPCIQDTPSASGGGHVDCSYLKASDQVHEPKENPSSTACATLTDECKSELPKRMKIYKSTESRNASPCPSLDMDKEARLASKDKSSESSNNELTSIPNPPPSETASVRGKRRIAKESLDALLSEKDNLNATAEPSSPGKARRSSRRWSTKSSSHDSSRIETEFITTPFSIHALKHTASSVISRHASSRRWRSGTGSSWSYDSTDTGAEAIISRRRPWRMSRDKDRCSMISDTTLDEDAGFVVDEEFQKRENEHLRRLQEA